nr:2-C-methyl-D-erythritol 4-phosphate cytidylyltransferase [Candidatus Arsenophonus lipoptenae]
MLDNKINIIALIPAAGIGRRMQSNCPKQYLKIAGKTIIEHTISLFIDNPRISKIVISLNNEDIYFNQLKIAKHLKIKTVIGGCNRSDSVLFGLNYLLDELSLNNCWVLIHDAVRPCLHKTDLNSIINFIDNDPNSCGGILSYPVRDTIKRSFKGKISISHTIERNDLWHALTPQFFPLELIKNCLTKALSKKAIITDEASALEYCGYYPKLLNGRFDNLKITKQEDLILAEFYLSRNI